ncbi:GTP pyrophosphokinase rsh [Entomobacter blattae]|uniref:GTP pyrophosphokinase rsh n=2 Tax=Entomobacter blattae TaxID=2762277 RepID=A0A7H1NSK0_9PROT|nr:GTP pyrophosphokinase rsh [Entomobacter blattae]
MGHGRFLLLTSFMPLLPPDGRGNGKDPSVSVSLYTPGVSATLSPGHKEIGQMFKVLLERIKSYNPEAETDVLQKAYAIALEAHKDQKRDNGDPYITHPLAVASILAGFRLDIPSIATALLHDTVEDTTVTLSRIRDEFGNTVAELVDGVTKLTRLELQSDRTKQAENFRKLVLAMSKDIRVLIVKLADRLHNMRTLRYVKRQDRRQRIARETMDIYAPLAGRIGMDKVKTELQNLSFAELEPEANSTIRARLNYLRGQGADAIEDIRRELLGLLQSLGLKDVTVTGREKSPYSIWEKMQRRQVRFEQLSDIMAFRIIVPTREACYMALGVVHAEYQMIAGRFKDYISTPKANGYQSLHTGVTLREPRNQKIEIQIRTTEMHDIAENGVAAHWAYKQKSDEKDIPSAVSALGRLRWMRDLLEILEDSSAPDEFLENTKLELYQDQVFCFTPKGQLIQLPRGATPVDFAYAVHSQVGDRCVGAKINGRLMPLRYELQNGDQVEIITARGGTPSSSWERFVVTGKARARIRRFIAQQQRSISLDAGRAALAKAFRQEGLDGSDKVLEPLLKTFRMASLDDLFVAVQNNHINIKEVLWAAYPELKQATNVSRMVPSRLISGRSRSVDEKNYIKKGMAVTGIGAGVATSFAGCCHPLPGDRIVGIVTTGKGVTIHRSNCRMLENFSSTPERFLEVEWQSLDKQKEGAGALPYVGRINVVGVNSGNVLASLVNIISKYEGAVVNMKVINRQLDFVEIILDVEVRDLKHFSSVIAGIRGSSEVVQAERAVS